MQSGRGTRIPGYLSSPKLLVFHARMDSYCGWLLMICSCSLRNALSRSPYLRFMATSNMSNKV